MPVNDRSLMFVAVHLTSNHSGNMGQRMQQLDTVYNLFDEQSPIFAKGCILIEIARKSF